MKKICITLNEIMEFEEREYNKKLFGSMGNNVPDKVESVALKINKALNRELYTGEPIPLSEIVNALGLDYGLLCATMLPEHNTIWRNLTIWYGEQLIEQGLITDQDSINAITATKQYNNGVIDEEELGEVMVKAFAKVKTSFINGKTTDATKYFIIPTVIASITPNFCMLDRSFIADPLVLPKFLEVVG